MDYKEYERYLIKKSEMDAKNLGRYKVKVPEGKSGPWAIRRFKTELDIDYLRHCRDGRDPGLGEFTKLAHKDRGIVMSDTHPEIRDVIHNIEGFSGKVLVTGLGLGMVVQFLLRQEGVDHITVIEKDPHVIKLSGPTYKGPKVTIIRADAYEWRPVKGTRFNFAWHDIWDGVAGEETDEMRQLREHYSPFVGRKRQRCWGEREERYVHF